MASSEPQHPDPRPSVPPGALPAHELTVLIERAHAGDAKASAELLPLVYDELRALARARLGQEAPGQTLQPTALVHEVYIRLLGPDPTLKWDNRGHFFGAAARAMRRILIERARHRRRLKHGGGRDRIEFPEDLAALTSETLDTEPQGAELERLDIALTRLEQVSARKAEVVMLRYFAGLKLEEVAAALGVSLATVKNDWAFARAWLHRELAAISAPEDTG